MLVAQRDHDIREHLGQPPIGEPDPLGARARVARRMSFRLRPACDLWSPGAGKISLFESECPNKRPRLRLPGSSVAGEDVMTNGRISQERMEKALAQEKAISQSDHQKVKALAAIVKTPRSMR